MSLQTIIQQVDASPRLSLIAILIIFGCSGAVGLWAGVKDIRRRRKIDTEENFADERCVRLSIVNTRIRTAVWVYSCPTGAFIILHGNQATAPWFSFASHGLVMVVGASILIFYGIWLAFMIRHSIICRYR